MSRLCEALLHRLRPNVADAWSYLHKVGLRCSSLCHKTINDSQPILCHRDPCTNECGNFLSYASAIPTIADVLGRETANHKALQKATTALLKFLCTIGVHEQLLDVYCTSHSTCVRACTRSCLSFRAVLWTVLSFWSSLPFPSRNGLSHGECGKTSSFFFLCSCLPLLDNTKKRSLHLSSGRQAPSRWLGVKSAF